MARLSWQLKLAYACFALAVACILITLLRYQAARTAEAVNGAVVYQAKPWVTETATTTVLLPSVQPVPSEPEPVFPMPTPLIPTPTLQATAIEQPNLEPSTAEPATQTPAPIEQATLAPSETPEDPVPAPTEQPDTQERPTQAAEPTAITPSNTVAPTITPSLTMPSATNNPVASATPRSTATHTPTPTITPTATPFENQNINRTPRPTDGPTPTETPTLPDPSFDNCQSEPNPNSAPDYPIMIISITKDEQGREFVMLRNESDQIQDLTGWRLCSLRAGQQHPISGTLNPGQEFNYQGSINQIWNLENGDEAALYNPQGQLVSFMYR